MIEIIFEAHGTTYDNEDHKASGWNDVPLSPLGMKQSGEMGDRYKDDHFDAVFTSDLQRAEMSALIGFVNKDWPILVDKRLRECNYGDLTQHPSGQVDSEKRNRISKPFPNGESYEQAGERVKNFLQELLINYDDKRVMIIGHRATQFGIEHWVNGVSYQVLTTTPFKWQPGWNYIFDKFNDKIEGLN